MRKQLFGNALQDNSHSKMGYIFEKALQKTLRTIFKPEKLEKLFHIFTKKNSYFLGQLYLWNSFRECFGFKTALTISIANRVVTVGKHKHNEC